MNRTLGRPHAIRRQGERPGALAGSCEDSGYLARPEGTRKPGKSLAEFEGQAFDLRTRWYWEKGHTATGRDSKESWHLNVVVQPMLWFGP
jgi:hypothetical protein